MLTTVGGVWCFGQNNFDQLGDTSGMDQLAPVGVSGLSTGVVAIGAGQSHACALTTSGGVKCWGANYAGQLGDNSAMQQPIPVDVLGLTSGVVAIAVGPLHTCALTVGGGMKCWGLGIALGNGSNSQRNAPVDVLGLTSGVVAIGAGGFNSCALTAVGGMKCWGGNVEGELGDASTNPRLVPGDVSGLLAGVSAIAVGGSHACALTTGGGMKCWGSILHGQVGNNSPTNQLTPADVVGLTSGVTAISAGSAQTCALLSGGYMKCWGNNASGQLGNGDGTGADQPTPVDVKGLGNLGAAISAGGNHTCARTAGGNVACWGDGFYGQLGDGNGASGPLPVGVSGFSTNGVAMVRLGESHTCALTHAGGVKCWGFNNQGELGNNSIAQSLVPVDVTGLTSGVASIGASKFHSCAVTTGGAVQCWGQNTSGSLGDGTQTERHVPTNVFGLTSGYSAVSLGSNHSCALSAVGGTMCWGGNSVGVLGDGTYNQQLLPVSVQQSVNYLAISAGDSVTCARAFGGFTQCWGANNAGQLGQGVINSPIKTNVPGTVPGLAGHFGDRCRRRPYVRADAGIERVEVLGSQCRRSIGRWQHSQSSVAGRCHGAHVRCRRRCRRHRSHLRGHEFRWRQMLGQQFLQPTGRRDQHGRPSPVDVVGLASGAISIEAGVGHTLRAHARGGREMLGPQPRTASSATTRPRRVSRP